MLLQDKDSIFTTHAEYINKSPDQEIKQEKEMKDIQIEKEGVKLLLFKYSDITYRKSTFIAHKHV